MTDLAARKSALRREMATRRALVHLAPDAGARMAEACARAGDALHARFGNALAETCLAAYWPMRSELDPRALLRAHAGVTCLPVVMAPAQPLRFRLWSEGEPLVAGAYGISEPVGHEVQPDIVIVPLLAFDRRGMRLGYGGGFYDRTLAHLRAVRPCLAIGLGFAAQEHEGLPRAETDVALDGVVTEREVIWP